MPAQGLGGCKELMLMRALLLLQVRRFARFVLGEGIEKKEENFAAEIAAATGQS